MTARKRPPPSEHKCAGGCGTIVYGRMKHCDECGRFCSQGCGRRTSALDRALCHPCEFQIELEQEAAGLSWQKNRHGIYIGVRC